MTVIKKYNTGTSAWETIVVGKQGPPGPVVSVAHSKIIIDDSYTFPANYNGLSVGPVTIDDSVEVTVPNGAVWTISPWEAAVSTLRQINTSGTGLSGGGDLSADRTIMLDPSALAGDAAFAGAYAPRYFVENVVTANYTLALTDVAKVVAFNSSSNLTLTVPTNASVAFPLGTVINVYRAGTGTVTIAGASGVTVRNSGTIPAQFGERSLRKRGTNEWVLI